MFVKEHSRPRVHPLEQREENEILNDWTAYFVYPPGSLDSTLGYS